EDGIRDRNVTGVQTCALPIWPRCPPTWPPWCSRSSPPWKPAGCASRGGRRWTDRPPAAPPAGCGQRLVPDDDRPVTAGRPGEVRAAETPRPVAAAGAYPGTMSVQTDPQPAAEETEDERAQAGVTELAVRARTAARALRSATTATKDAALHGIADALVAATAEITAANAIDVQRESAAGMSPGLVDRLRLDETRI